jgi:threonine synthase
LAKLEGVFAEPTGVVSLAGAISLKEKGVIEKGEAVCVPITGSGFKDIEVVEKEFKEPRLIDGIEELEF